MCDTATEEHAAYCVTLRLCELLELARQGDIFVPWDDWAEYTSIWEKKGLLQHIFSDYCVAGWRLACPLKDVEPDRLTFEVHEFNSRRGPLASISSGNSLTDTGPVSPTSVNVGSGLEGEGRVPSNLRSSERVKELVFKWKEGTENPTNLSTNVMITEDNLILVTVRQSTHPSSLPRCGS